MSKQLDLVGNMEGIGKKELYEEFAARGYTKGCEVGVRRADNARHMFSVIPNLHLILVDPYMMYEFVNQRRHNKWKWSQEKMDAIRHVANRRMARFDVRWYMTTSEQAAPMVPDNSLDFVYIDGDHMFNAVMLDTLLWYRKVRMGGVLCGHDFGIRSVNTAVRSFAKRNHLRIGWTDRNKEKGKSGNVISWMIEKNEREKRPISTNPSPK